MSLLLDLYGGAGGCAVGYKRAGFEVVGVDLFEQPNYPFEFFQADAIETLDSLLAGGKLGPYRLSDFRAIHASPVCKGFSFVTYFHPGARDNHPDLLTPTRELLKKTGLPWIIENVPGAPMRRDLVLCGEMFGLRVHRHRLFEIDGFAALAPPHQKHKLKGAKHNCHIEEGHARQVAGNYSNHPDACDAMGIEWMTRKELAQAIPPAYTEYIGRQLIQHIENQAIAA